MLLPIGGWVWCVVFRLLALLLSPSHQTSPPIQHNFLAHTCARSHRGGATTCASTNGNSVLESRFVLWGLKYNLFFNISLSVQCNKNDSDEVRDGVGWSCSWLTLVVAVFGDGGCLSWYFSAHRFLSLMLWYAAARFGLVSPVFLLSQNAIACSDSLEWGLRIFSICPL